MTMTSTSAPAFMRTLLATVALAALLCSPQAQAGRTCGNEPLSLRAVTQGLALAERTARALDATGAQVVVLARAGQDLHEYSLRYSHLGLAYKDGERWRVLHKLNQCGTAMASVYREGLGDFFLDAPFEYVAGVLPLRADAQARLLPLLKNPSPVAGLHTRAYSMLAYPWAQTYQQSNQWAIETLAVAMGAEQTSREAAQDWLQDQGYTPTELHLSAVTRLGARLTMANVAFDDHPSVLRFTGRIRTVTVDSVFAWLQRSGLGAGEMVVR
jgi:hypothetical protein